MNKDMQDVINKINTIPIFDIMSVRGYCVYLEGVIRTFVYAADIAREAGIVTETKGKETSYATSGITYESIRWDRFNNYVNMSLPAIQQENLSLIPLIQLPIHAHSYIPCELALIVLMHCRSEKALRFQVRLATIIMPKIQQDTIEFYEDKVNELRSIIDTNKDTINYNIAVLQDIAEFGSVRELKDIIMSMTY